MDVGDEDDDDILSRMGGQPFVLAEIKTEVGDAVSHWRAGLCTLVGSDGQDGLGALSFSSSMPKSLFPSAFNPHGTEKIHKIVATSPLTTSQTARHLLRP